MVDCRKCKRFSACYFDNDDCIGFVPKTMTNADHIRSMTDEELLNLLCLKHCPTSIDPAFKCKDTGNCKPCWEEWLKQEVDE